MSDTEIISRINSFRDACKILETSGPEHSRHPLLKQWEDVEMTGVRLTRQTEAFMKLCIITAAYNQGWYADMMDKDAEYRIPAFAEVGDRTVEYLGGYQDKPKKVYTAGNGRKYYYMFSMCKDFTYKDGCNEPDNVPLLGLKNEVLADAAAITFADIYIQYMFG